MKAGDSSRLGKVNELAGQPACYAPVFCGHVEPDVSIAPAKVYLDYTQAELDRAYEQTAWVTNRDEIVAWWAAESAKVRAALPHHRGLAYGSEPGPGPDEVLDFFPAKSGAGLAPIHVHIHGGRWSFFTRDEESFIAPTFVDAGFACVIPDFTLIPKARLPDMVAQLQRMIVWLHANAAGFGGDASRIHVSGHSSGAHLAGVLIHTDWTALGLPADVIKSALLVSGMYDLRPVMLSSRSSYVKLSEAEVAEQSVILRPEKLNVPLTLVYGDRETPEFQRHPQDYARALRAAGRPVMLICLPQRNHFEILQDLGDANSALAREALRLMRS